MKNLLMCLAIFAVACGGSDFQPELFGAGGDGSGGETQTTNTGGQTTSTGGATGGAGVVGTGGLPGETGGAPTDDSGAPGGSTNSGTGGGGSPGTGGLPSGTGGEASGGAVNTGGVTSVLVTHSNGLGQTWEDDVALGTYNTTQAKKACEAWCAVSGCAGPCSDTIFCGKVIVFGQVGISGPSVTMNGWETNVGAVDQIDPITQNTCSAIGTWN